MRRVLAATLLLCVGLWLVAKAQEGRPSGPNPTAVGQAATGQIPGTATNDSASAGNVGEIIASIGVRLANGTITFTNGSAVIADTATCAANQLTGCVGIGSVVNLTTSNTLPTNFAINTNYFICTTGFVPGTSYELCNNTQGPTGTPIVAGSAGSGTQTRVSTNIGATTTNFFTVAAVSLTAGQWSCVGNVFHTFSSATSSTQTAFIGATHNSATGLIGESVVVNAFLLTIATGNIEHGTVPVSIKLAGTTEYYLIAEDVFSAGSVAQSGSLICTRMR